MRSEDSEQRTVNRGVVAAAPRPCNECRAAAHNRPPSVLGPRSSERGSTLVISLIILIVLMLLGVMTMNTSDTQYKLAGNLQFEDVAMSNAEQAIGAAERWLENDAAIKRATAAANSTVIEPSTAVSAVSITPLAMTWTDSEPSPNPQSTPVTGLDGIPNDRQRYVIGFVSTAKAPGAPAQLKCPNIAQNYNCVNTYLITGRGLGGRGATKLIQVYYSLSH